MIFSLFDLIRRDPRIGLVFAAVFLGTLLFSLVFHEFSHALIATALGDRSQRKLGRLSLNPFRHLDPTGTLLILIVGFGWAKPVQTDEARLRPTPVLGMALVGLAGPLSNLLLAAISSIPYRQGWYTFLDPFTYLPADLGPEAVVSLIAYYMIRWNILLAVFNLIPVPPLDGSWLLRLFLPRHLRTGPAYARIAQWGTVVFIAMIGIGFVAPEYSPLGWLIQEPLRVVSRLIVGRAIV
jgi:Zn-dependent protease